MPSPRSRRTARMSVSTKAADAGRDRSVPMCRIMCRIAAPPPFVRRFSDPFMPFDAGAKQRRGVASHEDIRMVRTILLTALTASTLAACSQSTPDNFSVAGGYLLSGEAAPQSQDIHLAQLPNAPAQPQQATSTRRIAVTRSFTLRLPGSEVAAVQERHLTECARLECTVLETRLDQLG